MGALVAEAVAVMMSSHNPQDNLAKQFVLAGAII